MDPSSLKARVLERLAKDDARSFPTMLPPQPPRHAEDSSSDSGEADSSSEDSEVEDFRIEVAPKSAARARKGAIEEPVDEEDSPAESDDGKQPSLITATRICSRRELSRCIRRDRQKIQIALAAMTLTILLFLLSTVWFLDNKAPTPDVRYRTDDIPQHAWLAAGWGLPPVIREQRTVKPLHPTGFH